MSNYKTLIESNNTELQGILDSVNALPDAGGTPGVCTINIIPRESTEDTVQLDVAFYINPDTGLPTCDAGSLRDSLTFTTTCGSLVGVVAYTNYELAISGSDLVAAGGYLEYSFYDPAALWMLTPSTPGTYNITVWSND